MAYHNKSEVDRAIGDYTKAITLKPNYANAYNNRGVAYYGKGDYEKAIADFNRAIDLRPDDAKTYYGRGDAYGDRGEFDKAINDYNMAIELNPKFAPVYYKRGEARLRLREWDKAKSDLTAAGEMGADIIASFHNDYESVPDFERRNGVKLPEDLAAVLTSQVVTIGEEDGQEATHESASDFEIVLDEIMRKYDRAWKTLAKP